MIKANIAVLDSGIGGLSVLKVLDDNLSNKRFYYFGDNTNAPYGNKSIRELKKITLNNLSYLGDYDIDVIVLGCNTLSVNLLHEIEYYSNIKTFGVFPPVEYAKMRRENTLLLSTVATAKNYKKEDAFYPLGLENLAKDIEENVFNLNLVDLNYHFSSILNEKKRFETVILGCTHYEFIKNKIFNHLKPQNMISGVNFTLKALINYFKEPKSIDKTWRNEVYFIGKSADYNKEIYYSVVKKVLKK